MYSTTKVTSAFDALIARWTFSQEALHATMVLKKDQVYPNPYLGSTLKYLWMSWQNVTEHGTFVGHNWWAKLAFDPRLQGFFIMLLSKIWKKNQKSTCEATSSFLSKISFRLSEVKGCLVVPGFDPQPYDVVVRQHTI